MCSRALILSAVCATAYFLFVPYEVHALDAPCAVQSVSSPKITVSARVTNGSEIKPVKFLVDGEEHSGKVTLELAKKEMFFLDPAPPGWRYEEIRVSTPKETPAPIRSARCLVVVWQPT